jgi:iron complex outermembrane receptor protein
MVAHWWAVEFRMEGEKMTKGVSALKALVVAVPSAIAFLISSGAVAQEAPIAPAAPIERVEITGSHILQTEKEGVAPVQVITHEEIQRSGQPTVSDLLRTITANTGNSYNETFSNSFAPGSASISLRGLSPKNTLVLLNGTRVASFGFAQNIEDTFVDVNAIPANAVDRIEILKDGASAVYGSDAIAGVVNIILRRDYQGASVGGFYDRPTEGGMHEYGGDFLYGHGNLAADKYNVMLAANYFKNTQMLADDRSWSRSEDLRSQGGFFDWNRGPTYSTVPAQPFPGCGTIFPGHVMSGAATQPSAFSASPANHYCFYNPAPYIPLAPASEREQVVGNGTLQLSSNVEVFTNFLYAHDSTDASFTPAAVTVASTHFDPKSGGLLPVIPAPPMFPAGSPFLPPDGSAPGGANFRYTFFSVGPRDTNVATDFYRAVGGLKGSLEDWNWQTQVGYSESKVTQTNYNEVNVPTLQADMAYTGPLSGAPFNFFNPALTPNGVDALRTQFADKSTSKLSFLTLNVTTDLVNLPAGPLGFAIGAEGRHESIDNAPDEKLKSGTILNYGQTAVNGSRTNYAAYTEFSVPILKSLQAQAAGRYDHYSDFGSAGTPKFGLRFQPAKEFLGRFSISKGFRAPSLPEIAKSNATYFTTVFDPVLGALNGAAPGINVGNPKLKPERSTNYNLGFVLSPTPAASFGLDYYRIIQHDIVQGASPQGVIDANLPGTVLRDAAGNLLGLRTPYMNAAYLDTDGIDANMKATLGTDIGTFKLNWDVTYLGKYEETPGLGQPPISAAGNNNLNVNFYSGGALPRWRSVTALDLDRGPWTGRITENYIAGYFQLGGAGSQTEVNDWSSIDLYGEYRGFKNLKLYASVLNVLNQSPPIDTFQGFAFAQPFDFTLYDARDRVVRVGFEYTIF